MRACLQWKLAPAAVFCGMRTNTRGCWRGGEGVSATMSARLSHRKGVRVPFCVCHPKFLRSLTRTHTHILFIGKPASGEDGANIYGTLTRAHWGGQIRNRLSPTCAVAATH